MAASSSAQLVTAIGEFQAALTPRENSELLGHSSKPDITSIITFMTHIDEENAHRRIRCVSARLTPVLESIQGFSTIVDTFVSARPNIAALVWGTVKFFISAASNVISFFEKLSDFFLRLSKYCPRYSEYQVLFMDSARLQKTLCDFYATVIGFCTRAFQAIRNPGRSLGKAVLIPFEKFFGDFEDTLRKQNEEVKEEIKLASEQAASRERNAAAEHRKNDLFSRSLATDEAQKKKEQKELQRTKFERDKQLDKLSSHDYLSALIRIRKKRYGQTSSWLSESKQFKEWLEATKSSTLWLSGIPGSGKSTISAAIIENLLSRPRKSSNHIAFFFCEYDNLGSLTALTILGTLIRQCLSESKLSDIVEKRLKGLFEKMFLDVRDLEPLLQDIVTESGTTIFVIDGFDECHKVDRLLVLQVLQRLMSISQSNIKILLSSRHDVIGDIDRVFTTCYQVMMNCEEARADIQTYVNDMIDDNIQDGNLEIGNPQLKQDIWNALTNGANGMFLWVAFQIEDLCRQKCDADIRKTLNTLPKDLPETYDRILTRILEEGNAQIVSKIFRWIAAAKRPLLLDELKEAIAVEPGDRYLQKDRLVNNVNNVTLWCGGLTILQDEDSLVQFAHHSVKQFLLSEHYDAATKQFHFQLPEVDLAAGEICVTYLLFSDFERQVSRFPRAHHAIRLEDLASSAVITDQNRVARYGTKFVKMFTKKASTNFNIIEQLNKVSGKNPSVNSPEQLHIGYAFLTYARKFWLSHTAGFTPQNTSMWKPWERLILDDHPLAVKPWAWDTMKNKQEFLINYILDENYVSLIHFFETRTLDIPNSFLPDLLFEASRRGNAHVVKFILTLSNSKASDKDELSQGPAGGSHIEMIERSFTTKADVNATASKGRCRTALQAAAENGHIEVIEILLAAKADVNADPSNGDNGRTALQAAAGKGHVEVVERLLVAKAHVNAAASEYDGRTALQAAAEGGHMEIVERLLLAKADVNAVASIENGRTTLQAAAEGGHIEIVERLLLAKADVNAFASNGSHGRTALQAAAEGGHIEIVERLLVAKAYVNAAASEYYGRTALQAAAEGGHIETVERLLMAKAHVNAAASEYYGRTALQAAAEGGHIETVERLLMAEAHVNAAASKYIGRTALQAAAEGGHIETVERLLMAKADVNYQPCYNNGRTALQAAAEGGHIEIVERLLMAKAHVNAAISEYYGRTALQAAAEGGHIEIVERLLMAKADVNAKVLEDNGRTALQVAAEGGHIETVERLLMAKADVNAVASDYSGRTALQAAAEGGHIEIVEILLMAKADVNAIASEGGHGPTALQAAAEGGHIETVERLLMAKANVNAYSPEYSALGTAAKGGHIETVERLLKAKADVNDVRSRYTALEAARNGGHMNVIERLLEAGAK